MGRGLDKSWSVPTAVSDPLRDRESSKFSLNLSVSIRLSLKLSQQERELLNCDRALDLWHNKNADTNLYEVAACVARLSKKNYTFHLRSKPRARHTLHNTQTRTRTHTRTYTLALGTRRRQVEALQMATESGQ